MNYLQTNQIQLRFLNLTHLLIKLNFIFKLNLLTKSNFILKLVYLSIESNQIKLNPYKNST